MEGKIKTVLDAARETQSKRIMLTEKTLSYVSELAEVLADEAGDDEIFFRDEAFIRRYRALTDAPKQSCAAPFNENEISILEERLNEAEKALLCLSLSEILGITGIEGSGTFFDDPPKPSGETVATIKSRLSDDAYLSFTSDMTDPRVSYLHDLTEVAQSVLYGKTAYGILPMPSARALMLANGLKTAKRLKIKGADGTDADFVLVRKDLTIPENAENARFEFTLKTSEPCKLLTAAELCRMAPVSIAYSDDGVLNVTLAVSDGGFCGFLTYLSLNHPDFIPIGIYKKQ